MPFGLWAQVGPRNHVLNGNPDVKVQFLWKGHVWAPQACPTTLCRELCNTAELLEMPLGLWAQVSSRNNVLDGVTCPHAKEQFLGERTLQ